MIYRLLLVCFLWGILTTPSMGQSYFSKLYPFEEGAHRFISVEQVDSNMYWLQALKWLPWGSGLTGYYYMDGEGNLVDSFFYETEGLFVKALPAHNYFFKDDLIYQLCSYRDSENPHDIYVSSRSERDSVDRFSVEFNRPEWVRTFANTMTLYQDTIYIFGAAQIRTTDPNEHDIFMVKMDLQGNTIWVKDLDHLEYYGSLVGIMCNVLQKDGCFYFTHHGDGLGPDGNSRVYKVSTEGEMIWRSAEEGRSVDVQSAHPDITFTADSSAIVWTNNRQLYLEDVDNDQEVWLNKCYNPISLTFLDISDGSFIKDYLYIIDSIANKFGVNKVITSKFNGDYIFCGVWQDLRRDQSYYPLIGRVSPSGAFKWVKLVGDRWDSSFTAFTFRSLEEAHNGDLVLVGTVQRLPGETGHQPAWAMRIGPEGCVPDYVYCEEDTLIVNHPNIVVSSVTPQLQRNKLQVYPTHLSSGQTVYLGFPEAGFPLRGVADVRWINAAGQPVAEQRLTLVERAGYRTQVPLNLPSGLYFVEMRASGQQYVARVVVDR